MSQKILAVDDEPDVLRLTQFLLESWGYTALVAGSAGQAIEIANRESPALILMDVNMQEMNGHQACEALKADFATALIPIVMLTGQDQIHNEVTGFGKGADDYIIKSVAPEELRARVQMVLRRTQERSEANPLSRLPGHLVIEREINERISGSTRFSVFYCDLENFTTYNDQFGYEAGDRVIVHTAKLIQSAVQKHGTETDFIGHVGGATFVIITQPRVDDVLGDALLSQFDQSLGELYPERQFLNGTVDDHAEGSGKLPTLGISVAIVSAHPDDLESSLALAERAATLKNRSKRGVGSRIISERSSTAEPVSTSGSFHAQ